MEHHLTTREATHLIDAATGMRKVVGYRHLLRYRPQRQRALLQRALNTPGFVYFMQRKVTLAYYLAFHLEGVLPAPPHPPGFFIENHLTEQETERLRRAVILDNPANY